MSTYIILTKFLNGWVKIVDFLLIAYFWASVIFLLLSLYIHNFDISINHEMIFISLKKISVKEHVWKIQKKILEFEHIPIKQCNWQPSHISIGTQLDHTHRDMPENYHKQKKLITISYVIFKPAAVVICSKRNSLTWLEFN